MDRPIDRAVLQRLHDTVGVARTAGLDGFHGSLDDVQAALDEIDRMRRLVAQAEDAIRWTLRAAKQNPKGLGRYLGPHIESFERLCKAQAAILGEPPELVRDGWAR